MFVTVRYGEDQSKIFNINCRNQILLHQIKKRCKMNRDGANDLWFTRVSDIIHRQRKLYFETIELSDENGTVKNLRQNLHEYGRDYLKERETLILLRVDSCNPDADMSVESISDKVVYIPMLANISENQEFIEALNPRSHMGSKNSLLDELDGKGKKAKKKDKKEKKPKPPAPAK